MNRSRIFLVVVIGLAGATGLQAEGAPKKKAKLDAAGVLKRIDAALFFPDTQAGLESYMERPESSRFSPTSGRQEPPAALVALSPRGRFATRATLRAARASSLLAADPKGSPTRRS